MKRLLFNPLTHTEFKQVYHPGLRTEIIGRTCVRYLSFHREVSIDKLILPREPHPLLGRSIPRVPIHPAHLIVSVMDKDTGRWRVVKEVEPPYDPRLAGEGLSLELSVAELEEKLFEVLDEAPIEIGLDGLRTDHLRVECDREHPICPNHGEMNGGPYNVPFRLLDNLEAHGEIVEEALRKAPHQPLLSQGEVKPTAPNGMKVRELPHMLLFEGKRFSIGFSLRRPLLMHLGWDAFAQGGVAVNRLMVSRKPCFMNEVISVGGPMFRDVDRRIGSHLWTGNVEVQGNTVKYLDLSAVDGLKIDAVFTVTVEGVELTLEQHCSQDMFALEAEAWRLPFSSQVGGTGTAGVPTLKSGRNGDVAFPAMFSTDGWGCLSCELVGGDRDLVHLQTESYRVGPLAEGLVANGIVLGRRADGQQALTLPKGTARAELKLAVTNWQPKSSANEGKASPGVEKRWSIPFSCFRPEFRGFANHAVSTYCHVHNFATIEIVANSQKPLAGLNPMDLARYTIGNALLDGGGYGHYREFYMEIDPILISMAGRIHQAEPDDEWLRKIEPGLLAAVERISSDVGEDGLRVCHNLSGNSGSARRSCNGFDVVVFGHIDAYSNAFSYRAFRNATAMLLRLGHGKEAEDCRRLAEGIRENYARVLLNPETGWVAGWRSCDGELHDYGYTFINGPAIAFGLLDVEAGRRALLGLEKLRADNGIASAVCGLPHSLIPIKEEDYSHLPGIGGFTESPFETYLDGASMTGPSAMYYLRALRRCGLNEEAARLADDLDVFYEAGIQSGPNFGGQELVSWEGLPTGYEGTLSNMCGALYSLAIERGIIKPFDPEWWPDDLLRNLGGRYNGD